MADGNLFANIPADLPEERIDILLEREGLRMERIVSRGHASPPGFWYDQPTDEWVVLLSGSAGLSFEDSADEVVLRPGDYLFIAAHRRHRVEWTAPDEDTVWLAFHF
jgi:cupin 2 domain-containing protein